MKKVILFIAASLDGYIASPDGSIDWLFTDQDYGFSDFYQEVDTVVLGRHTYEQVLTFDGQFPYAGKNVYVISMQKQPPAEHVIWIQEHPNMFISRLKSFDEDGKIWLVGGSQIVHALHKARLIDEYIVYVHPLVLGDGIPLFPAGDMPLPLKLASKETFDTGLVRLHYTK